MIARKPEPDGILKPDRPVRNLRLREFGYGGESNPHGPHEAEIEARVNLMSRRWSDGCDIWTGQSLDEPPAVSNEALQARTAVPAADSHSLER